jgi:hypothetical protein
VRNQMTQVRLNIMNNCAIMNCHKERESRCNESESDNLIVIN